MSENDEIDFNGINYPVNKSLGKLTEEDKFYKKFLMGCSLIYLKNIVKQYNLHNHINTNKALKSDLVKDLMYHTSIFKQNTKNSGKKKDDVFIIYVKDNSQNIKGLIRKAFQVQGKDGAKSLGRLGERGEQPRVPKPLTAHRQALTNKMRDHLIKFGIGEDLLKKLDNDKLTKDEIKNLFINNVDRVKYTKAYNEILKARKDRIDEKLNIKEENKKEKEKIKREDKKIKEVLKKFPNITEEKLREKLVQEKRKQFNLEKNRLKLSLQKENKRIKEMEDEIEIDKNEQQEEAYAERNRKDQYNRSIKAILNKEEWQAMPTKVKQMSIDLIKTLVKQKVELPKHLENYFKRHNNKKEKEKEKKKGGRKISVRRLKKLMMKLNNSF